jgi:ubiquinone/menaquinone biosynthesis C-methylase UbiE
MVGPLGRFAYTVTQGARVAGYLGEYMLALRLARRNEPPQPATPKPQPTRASGPGTGMRDVLRDLAGLMQRDLDNIAAGTYRMPHDLLRPPLDTARDAWRFFRDLQAVDTRRRRGDAQEVFRAAGEERAGYPRYYLQNFHYQTDGYLSRRSAALYDHQVEVLFTGGADAMRRQALVPLAGLLRETGVAGSRLIDLGCGTGRFLGFVKANYPRLDVTGIDLSPYYLERAAETLRPWSRVQLVQGPAEALPLADASQTAVTSVFVFHELPRKVRAQVVAEAARVLRPGGLFILVDSIQAGDHPPYDRMVDRFPERFHEPYYADYARQDLVALFAEAGLAVESVERAFFAKVVVARKPA